MVFIAYTFKGQVHVFAGQAKIVSHSSCRTSAILKYFCPLPERSIVVQLVECYTGDQRVASLWSYLLCP